MKRLGVEIRSALVEHVGGEAADARLVGGILRRTSGEGKLQRDQRHGGVLNEPGFDAAG